MDGPSRFFPLPLGETTLNSLDVGGLISLRDVYVRLGWLPYPLRLLIDFPITRIRGVLRTHSPRSASFRVQPAFPTTNKPSRFLCPTCSRPAAGVFAIFSPPRAFFRSSRPERRPASGSAPRIERAIGIADVLAAARYPVFHRGRFRRSHGTATRCHFVITSSRPLFRGNDFQRRIARLSGTSGRYLSRYLAPGFACGIITIVIGLH